MMTSKPVPKFLWLYAPVLFILVQVMVEVVLPRDTLESMHSENGTHELLQAFILGMGFLMALWVLPKVDWARQKLVGLAVVIAALGCLYITGEEISWGQHIADWSTPEFWASVNDQNETNLHNTSDWLDQKPRLLLFVGIVFSGLLIPFLKSKFPHLVPSKLAPLYPSNILIPTSLGVLIPHMMQKIAEHFFDAGLFVRVSEVQEIYIYYFVFLYLWDLRNREIS